MARRSWVLSGVVVLAAALVAFEAAGQSRDEALLREGVELRAQGRDAEALTRFREAWRVAPTPRARAQMGWAAQALGRWREAESLLREAVAAQGDPWIERNRGELARSLSDVSARLGDLSVACEVAGARLFVDGEFAGTLPLAAPLRAPLGAVTLRVEADGFIAVTREGVRVRAGEVTREHVALAPDPATRTRADAPTPAATPAAPAPAPAPTVVVVPVQGSPAPAARGSAMASLGYTLLGLGAAGAVTAALGFALREAAVDRYTDGVREGACVGADLPAASETVARCYDERSAMETWGALRWVGLGVGVAGAAAGVALVLLDGSRGEARAVACGPWPGALGATCAARF
jgi:tetratricopeptide (TPR) repeat protein